MEQNPTKTALAVFDVGVAKLRRNQKPYADLVILSKCGLYPLWLRIVVISARVEVLRRKQGAYSGIEAVCILICIGRDAPFGAKPPQAGSHRSLMYLFEAKELFYHKGCKFTFQGVDQTLRRPLAVLLFRNC